MAQKKRILAIDQSSRTSGWCVIDETDAGAEVFECGKFEIVDDDVGRRLVDFKNEVTELIETYDPDLIAFEDIQLQTSVGNNVKTFKVLAMVFGVLLEMIDEADIPYEVVSAATWKSKLDIKGRSRPEQKRSAQE